MPSNACSMSHDGQQPDDQSFGTERVLSSIPKGDSGSNWKYPSNEQFYDSLQRKGYKAISEEQVRLLVPMHNVVNEQCWQEIRRWERVFGRTEVALDRFIGRQNVLSPKAFIRSTFGGYVRPFDRHDWYVASRDEGSGKLVRKRYVIDFYSGPKTDEQPMSIFLDVRPDVFSLDGACLRLAVIYRKTREAFLNLFQP